MVLDSSGSMQSLKEDTIGGFNAFLDDQEDEDGEATITLYDFNTNVDCVYQAQDIEDAPRLDAETYTPSGQTALHDAIVAAIDTAADRIETLEDDQPDTVIVVVLTDGKENASETPHDTVREQVETRQNEYDWEFLFIGANQDAALTAEGMGIDSDRALSMSASGEGTREAYTSTSRQVTNARSPDASMDGFDEEDRQRQRDADPSS
jgi:uncharacterized protein YegL